MDFKEAAEKMRLIRQELEAGLEVRGRVAGSDAAALIASRVRETGTAADGQAFSPYSDRPMAAWKLIGRSRTQSADDKVRALAKKREPISYKDFRSLNGLKVDKKNFEFTGEMWRFFDVKAVVVSNKTIEVIIGGTTKASEERLTWNSSKEGKLINDISDKELQLISDTLLDWVRGVINKNLP